MHEKRRFYVKVVGQRLGGGKFPRLSGIFVFQQLPGVAYRPYLSHGALDTVQRHSKDKQRERERERKLE